MQIVLYKVNGRRRTGFSIILAIVTLQTESFWKTVAVIANQSYRRFSSSSLAMAALVFINRQYLIQISSNWLSTKS